MLTYLLFTKNQQLHGVFFSLHFSRVNTEPSRDLLFFDSVIKVLLFDLLNPSFLLKPLLTETTLMGVRNPLLRPQLKGRGGNKNKKRVSPLNLTQGLPEKETLLAPGSTRNASITAPNTRCELCNRAAGGREAGRQGGKAKHLFN